MCLKTKGYKILKAQLKTAQLSQLMRLSFWWTNRIRVHLRALSSVSSPSWSTFSPLGLLRTLRAAASAWAFRMLLFRSSGVRSGVTHGLLPALFSPHFSVSFTTSSCWSRVRCHRGFIKLCCTCVCLCWTASELHRSAAGLHQSNHSLILVEITQTHLPGCSWPRWRWCYFSEQREADCSPTPAASDELLLLRSRT